MPPATEMVSGTSAEAVTLTSAPAGVAVALAGAGAAGGVLDEAVPVSAAGVALSAVTDATESVPGAGEKGDSGVAIVPTAVVESVMLAVTDWVAAGSLGAGAVAVGEEVVPKLSAALSAPPPPPPHPVSASKAAPQKSPANPFRFWSAIIKKHLRFIKGPELCAR
jgi:hypothetical protein